MLKEFLMKKMLQTKLGDIPEAERAKILAMVEKNPALFVKIAEEIKEKSRGGKDQMAVAMEVMKGHADEFKSLM
ncbi:MAG: hypothetical protein AAB511_03945 [Patescibacteria group bacterium]